MQPTAQKIDQLQVTGDTLTSRAGLTFLVKYVEAIGILTLLLNRFAKIKKSVKGVSVGNLGSVASRAPGHLTSMDTQNEPFLTQRLAICSLRKPH
jgi:hypothetical protein